MLDDLVSIKGVKDGLLITLSATEDWSAIKQELATRLDERSEFFAGALVTVDVSSRPVPRHEMTSLKALLERRNLTLMAVMSDSDTTLSSADALDLRASVSTDGTESEMLPIDSEEEGVSGVMVRHTLRSGRTIHSRGHVVVLGDVNPGAEIVAAGDIVVWGKLRGTVHAGCEGDAQAVVCALDMTPALLRIAGMMTTSPPPSPLREPRPEMALIREGQIVVEAWNA